MALDQSDERISYACMHVTDPTEIDCMNFGQLDELRAQLGISQNRVCQRAEINPMTYTRWRKWLKAEPGGCKPRPDSLRKLRRVIGSELPSRLAS